MWIYYVVGAVLFLAFMGYAKTEQEAVGALGLTCCLVGFILWRLIT
jgi:hypothetical protein